MQLGGVHTAGHDVRQGAAGGGLPFTEALSLRSNIPSSDEGGLGPLHQTDVLYGVVLKEVVVEVMKEVIKEVLTHVLKVDKKALVEFSGEEMQRIIFISDCIAPDLGPDVLQTPLPLSHRSQLTSTSGNLTVHPDHQLTVSPHCALRGEEAELVFLLSLGGHLHLLHHPGRDAEGQLCLVELGGRSGLGVKEVIVAVPVVPGCLLLVEVVLG